MKSYSRWIRDQICRVLRCRDTGNAIIDKAAILVAMFMIEGDYLEFGCFRGRSLIAAHKAIGAAYEMFCTVDVWAMYRHEAPIRRKLFDQMRFFAFDSFKGLPAVEGLDALSEEFKEGMYACSESDFLEIVTSAGVPREKVITVPGFYRDSLKPELRDQLKLRKAAVVWIDCDLYESTKDALGFVQPLLQDGTIFIFDDWFGYRGNPTLGEQRAWNEFIQANPTWLFTEYQKEGPWRNSFIVSARY
jgi:O-methyltransferase